MKGFLIVLFAVCMFAFAKFCCDEKKPQYDHTAHPAELSDIGYFA